MNCPAGFFCDTLGLADYTANICPAGYFCPLGTSVSTANLCTPGHYCPGGTHDEIICDAGTFQDLAQQTSCKQCTAGNYCPYTYSTPLAAEVTCPAGYKCPDPSMAAPAPCHEGEY